MSMLSATVFVVELEVYCIALARLMVRFPSGSRTVVFFTTGPGWVLKTYDSGP